MAEKNYALKSKRGAKWTAPELPYQPQDPKSYRPKIGMIGTGGITASHLDAYRKAGYEVVALCDLELKRAEERRKEFFPDAKVSTDPREVLDRADIDVVDIATHPPERAPLIRAALEAGKHVLSQKPFVVDLDLGEELVALADAKGLRLAVNQNGRWSPHFSYIRHAVRAGLLGDVLGVHLGVHWNHDWVAGTPFDEVRHVILYDFAIHWFDALSSLMPDRRATRVYASNAYAKGQTAKPPLLGQALVEFEGAQASLVFDAFNQFGSLDRTFVAGTEGSLRSEGPDLGNQTLTFTTQAGAAKVPLQGSWFNDGFHGTMGELLCAIEENREPTNSARDNLRSLEICFAALRSAETGEPQIPGKVRRLTS